MRAPFADDAGNAMGGNGEDWRRAPGAADGGARQVPVTGDADRTGPKQGHGYTPSLRL